MEKMAKRQERRLEILKQYKLAHQTLAITGINFETKSLVGYVEITIHPLRADLKRLKVNSKQCRVYRISVNDQNCDVFFYNDPGLDICQSESLRRDIEFFKGCHLAAMENTDPERCNGELTICLPAEVQQAVSELRPLRINIEFSLEEPEGGIQFVVPEMEGTMAERSAHLFSCGRDNSSRLWFPCLDSYADPCTWKLEFTVDNDMTAVSCGDLIETVYTSDMRRKTFHYYLSVPTAAPNIGLAVGPFLTLVDGNMNEVTHFCLPFLMPVLKHSTAFLHQVFEFYEELLSTRYPYSCYRQVFVAQAYEDCRPYGTMTIFSTNLLHSSRIIDQTPVSRKLMAEAVAQQFFGSFISMQSWCDAWLTRGISGYLSYLYVKHAFGNNEYRYSIGQMLNEVQEYERDRHPIVLDPSITREHNTYFPVRSPHTIPTRYGEMMKKKAILVIRMLELRIGLELLLQVFNKLLAVANNAAQQKFSASTWHNMHLSTSSFLKVISLVTGKDCQYFMDQWVSQSGCARFSGSFVFNRKRNVVELELKQDMNAKGAMKYVGPLVVTIQELDGSFNHNFKIEENKTRFEITCHSKSRRNKKKKIPLVTGEEVDMDLSAMDDSPVLWLRIDPDMQILRHVVWEQPDYMWQYQLKFERDVVAQCEAIHAMMNYATPATRLALTDTVEGEQCFYRIRMEATMCLALVANSMVTNWAGPPAMMTIFRKMFGSHSCSTIVKQNNFSNFQHYFLQKTIPIAMATLRDVHGICPIEVISFLLDLFKYNDNSKCKFSDCYYRASLIDAAASTLTPAVTVPGVGGQPTADCLTPETKLILDEVVRYLNLEKLMPCYRLVVTVSCLRALRKLQKFGHTPRDALLFRSYAQFGNFLDVRLAGLEALVDFVKEEGNAAELNWLLNIVEDDLEPYVKHRLVQMLTQSPPFTRRDSESRLNTVDLVERLWKLINSVTGHDSRLRSDLVDLYVTLYGRTRPSILPGGDPPPPPVSGPTRQYVSKRGRPPLSSYASASVVISASPRTKPQIPHQISVSRSNDEETIDLSRPIKSELALVHGSVPEPIMEEEVVDEKPVLDYAAFLSRMGGNDKDKMDVSEENIDVEGIRSSDEGGGTRVKLEFDKSSRGMKRERTSKLSDDSNSPPPSPKAKPQPKPSVLHPVEASASAVSDSSKPFSIVGEGTKLKFSGLHRSDKKKKKKNKKHKKHKHKKQEESTRPSKVTKLSVESFAYPPSASASASAGRGRDTDSESSSAEFEVI